ncbi:MAG: hypothetical protein DHS20C18_07250 [Saprospiraceae bacterium]|nr:MAG: hypothetical protein DHS20C18_07250 [Saprospiraceae bacterium]
MQLTGKHIFNASVSTIWNIMMDTDTLAEITPGITRLEPLGKDQYKAIADIKMGPVQGSFSGDLEVAEKNEPKSFVLKIKQNSKIGNVAAAVNIQITPVSEQQTELAFNGDAHLSGLLAQTGNRVLSGVANTLTKQFFKAMEKKINP